MFCGNLQIAGVVLNGILHPGDIEKSLQVLPENNDEEFKKIFNLLYTENLKVDLFKVNNVDKIFEIRILSVDNKFRRQGIAQNLLKTSEQVALKHGFKVSKIELYSFIISRNKCLYPHIHNFVMIR